MFNAEGHGHCYLNTNQKTAPSCIELCLCIILNCVGLSKHFPQLFEPRMVSI